MDGITDFLVWLWTLTGVKFIVTHVLINLLVAVAAGMYTGEFQLKKLGEFLYRKLAPFVLVYGAVKAFGIESGVDWLALPVWAIVEATLVADLAGNLERLGVPMPEWMTKEDHQVITIELIGVPGVRLAIGGNGADLETKEDEREPV